MLSALGSRLSALMAHFVSWSPLPLSALAMTCVVSGNVYAQEGVSSADSFKRSTYDLIRQITGETAVPDQAGIYLSDINDGPAVLLVNNSDCTAPVAEEGWFVADSLLSVDTFDLDESDLAAGLTAFREVVVQGTLSGSAGTQVVVLSAYVAETADGTSISAVAQRWRADPSEDDVDYGQTERSAAGGACEAGCIATWRAQDAIALAAYRTTATTIALTFRKCLKDAKKDCAIGGGAGCILLTPAIGVVGGGACYLLLSLDCADAADVSRTAALGVLEAARNANATTAGACIRACRAKPNPPATPAPIVVMGVMPTAAE